MPLSFSDEAYIVKALYLYVVSRHYVTADALNRRVAQLAGNPPSKKIFSQVKTSDQNLKDWLPHYRKAILEVLARDDVPIAPIIERHHALLTRQEVSETHEDHSFFLDPFEIERKVFANPDRRKNVIGQYCGFWRVYRLNTDSDETNPRINRSFLTIWSGTEEVAQEQGVPWFKLFFRSEGTSEPTRRATGAVFPVSERLFFLGSRVSDDRPYVAAMVWPYGDAERGQIKHRRVSGGLTFLANSHGEQITAYVIAKFVEGSHNMDKATFRDRRDQEVEAINVLDPAQLLDELTPEELDKLIGRSKKLVFTIRQA
jgi:hypothetical protein